MAKYSFTDKELSYASAYVANAMLASLPAPGYCCHRFSSEFERKMALLCAKVKRRAAVISFFRAAAAVFLCILIGAVSWLAVDVDARAAVQKWVSEIFDDHVVYRFEGDADSKLPVYEITWLPEGFELMESHATPTHSSVYFSDSNGNLLSIRYGIMHDGIIIEFFDPTHENQAETFACENVSINGMDGKFYSKGSGSNTNNLIWFDNNLGIYFSINSSLNKSVIMHIAQCLELANSTN